MTTCPPIPSGTLPLREVHSAADQELATRCARGRITAVDDDPVVLHAVKLMLESAGYACDSFTNPLEALEHLRAPPPLFAGPACLLTDVRMPGLSGLALQQALGGSDAMPIVLMSGASGAGEAIAAFRAGAVDFLLKPIESTLLIDAVARALERNRRHALLAALQARLQGLMAALTPRELEVARAVARGSLNRVVAEELGIAERTVKHHRQKVMAKLQVETVVQLARLLDALPADA